jgi:hypothetical protein
MQRFIVKGNFVNHFARIITFTTLLTGSSVFFSLTAAAQEVPKEIQAPADTKLLMEVHAKGDQIYTCEKSGALFTWTLKAPDAQLFDKNGKLFGKHFAGPSWEANDGSRVTGKAVANALSPVANSVPWLLLRAESHEGNGVLAHVAAIQRVNTKGGKAPAVGCDASHTGDEVRKPYSADYRFFVPK